MDTTIYILKERFRRHRNYSDIFSMSVRVNQREALEKWRGNIWIDNGWKLSQTVESNRFKNQQINIHAEKNKINKSTSKFIIKKL